MDSESDVARTRSFAFFMASRLNFCRIRCVSDVLTCSGETLPPNYALLASIGGLMPHLIVSYFTLFCCYFIKTRSFLKGNRQAVNMKEREVGGW